MLFYFGDVPGVCETFHMASKLAATELLDPANLADPYPFYLRLRERAPVWQVPDTRIFVVTRFDLLDEATKRTADFSSTMTSVLYRKRSGAPGRLYRQRGVLQVLATADPPLHGRHKAAVMPNFTARRIAELQSEIEHFADSFIDRAVAAGKVDFMACVANPLPMDVVSQLVGFPEGNTDKLLNAAFDSTAIVSGSSSLPALLWNMVRSYWVNRWIAGQLASAEVDRPDILGAIKRSIKEGTLREIEGRSFLHLFLAAGGESTTSLLGSAVRMLADNKALQQTLRDDPALIPAFVEEALRLESPFRYHLRSTPHETELGGVAIPEGSTVLLFWGAGNRDPDVFDDPDTLNLQRPRRHVTFGRGIHTCIGAPLARLEAQVVLGRLLDRTTNLSLLPSHPPRWVESLQVRRYQSLPLELTACRA